MLCKTIPRRYTIYSSLAFVLSVFISFLFLSSDSFAVSDYVIDVPSTASGFVEYFPCSDTDCSTYRYVIMSDLTGTFSAASIAASVNYGNNQVCVFKPIWSSGLVCSFSSSFGSSFKLTLANWPSGRTMKITLSEFAPYDSVTCPECEVCQVCPVVPDNPYDNKLDQLIRAVYVCAGTMLVLYFFYCIYRLIIKNSGVK